MYIIYAVYVYTILKHLCAFKYSTLKDIHKIGSIA